MEKSPQDNNLTIGKDDTKSMGEVEDDRDDYSGAGFDIESNDYLLAYDLNQCGQAIDLY